MASLNASNWCENPSTEFVSPQGYIQFWFYSFVITKRIRTKNPNLTQWWVNIACLVGFKLLWLNRSLVFSSKSPIYYHIAVSVFTICAQGMGAIIGNVESWKQMLKCQDDKSTFSRLTPICESQNVPFFDKIRRFMYQYIDYIYLCFYSSFCSQQSANTLAY